MLKCIRARFLIPIVFCGSVIFQSARAAQIVSERPRSLFQLGGIVGTSVLVAYGIARGLHLGQVFYQNVQQDHYWRHVEYSGAARQQRLRPLHAIALSRDLARINACSDNGDTPLISAIRCKNENLVDQLLGAGANPHQKNDHGHNAFDIANSLEAMYENERIKAGYMELHGLKRIQASLRRYVVGKVLDPLLPKVLTELCGLYLCGTYVDEND